MNFGRAFSRMIAGTIVRAVFNPNSLNSPRQGNQTQNLVNYTVVRTNRTIHNAIKRGLK
jgi:hypothetical protein